MKRIILGTAGHVDHGKTSLVRYMTGVNTDRLKEEAERGITIELGFAPFDLPSGQRIGIVDVPGHERFVKNMLAGATGIDLVLFVISADEGVMPQTREHMDILRLLGVTRGVVVLTKVDTVDADWLELVRDDVSEYLADGPLSGAEIINISSVTGEGIGELLAAIATQCEQLPQRNALGGCRLAVDRVFTMSGFGTVVTGTLWNGTITQGDTLELLPAARQVRVRSLQVHGDKRDEAYAGERVAVNLTGIERAQVERGSWLVTPNSLRDSRRMDIRLDMLPDAPELAQRTRVHVHHGTTEALARVVLLDKTSIGAGESCFAQLELEEPLAALAGDRLVLRFYSPMFTIGGGTVLEPVAAKHRRKNAAEELSVLSALHSGDAEQILLAAMKKSATPWLISDVVACLRTDAAGAETLVREMVAAASLAELSDGYFYPTQSLTELRERLISWLGGYFERYPMRFAAPKKELSQIHFPKMEQKQQRVIFRCLDGADGLEQDETTMWLAGRSPVITPRQAQHMDAIRELYAQAPFAPPTWSDAIAEIAGAEREQGEYLQWFLRSGEMVRLSDNVVYTRNALTEAERLLRAAFPEGFTLAQARDTFETNRKYAQQIGEYFDLIKTTYWDGERHFWHAE